MDAPWSRQAPRPGAAHFDYEQE